MITDYLRQAAVVRPDDGGPNVRARWERVHAKFGIEPDGEANSLSDEFEGQYIAIEEAKSLLVAFRSLLGSEDQDVECLSYVLERKLNELNESGDRIRAHVRGFVIPEADEPETPADPVPTDTPEPDATTELEGCDAMVSDPGFYGLGYISRAKDDLDALSGMVEGIDAIAARPSQRETPMHASDAGTIGMVCQTMTRAIKELGEQLHEFGTWLAKRPLPGSAGPTCGPTTEALSHANRHTVRTCNGLERVAGILNGVESLVGDIDEPIEADDAAAICVTLDSVRRILDAIATDAENMHRRLRVSMGRKAVAL